MVLESQPDLQLGLLLAAFYLGFGEIPSSLLDFFSSEILKFNSMISKGAFHQEITSYKHLIRGGKTVTNESLSLRRL